MQITGGNKMSIKFDELKKMLEKEILLAEKPFRDKERIPNDYELGYIAGLKAALSKIIREYL